MKRYAVEILDRYLKLQEVTNDHCIRAVVRFGSRLDTDALRQAILRSFERVPILGCRYVDSPGRPRWELMDFKERRPDFFTITDVPADASALVSALSRSPEYRRGPQLLATVIREPDRDSLCLVVNHMAFDGSGLKAYLYDLAALYGETNSEGIHPGIGSVERRSSLLFRALGFKGRIALAFHKRIREGAKHPVLSSEKGSPRLRTLEINSARYVRMRSFCRDLGVTVNDFALSLFSWTLFDLGFYAKGETVTIHTMIDLRRYDRDGRLSPFSNLASMEGLRIRNDGKTFEDLALEIREKTVAMKSRFPGLRNLAALSLAGRLFPGRLFDRILRGVIGTLNVSMSNLGAIDREKLRFAGVPVEDAYMVTALKKSPALQVSFSSFDSRMRFSVFGAYSPSDDARIGRILARMEEVLVEI